MTDSQQVAWFDVYEFVSPLLDGKGPWPQAGTPSWAALHNDDPRKLAAVLEAGVRWALHVDCEQYEKNKALAEASQAIAGAADWKSVARQIQTGRGNAYIPRRQAS